MLVAPISQSAISFVSQTPAFSLLPLVHRRQVVSSSDLEQSPRVILAQVVASVEYSPKLQQAKLADMYLEA